MGRIRTSQIKTLARELIEKYPNELSTDFDKNKEFLKNFIESKRFRNKLAGYVTRLMRRKK